MKLGPIGVRFSLKPYFGLAILVSNPDWFELRIIIGPLDLSIWWPA